MIQRVIILAWVICSCSGCVPVTDRITLRTLDSLSARIDSIEKTTRLFPYEDAERCFKAISSDMDSLKRFMSGSNLEKEEMNKIIRYYSLKKSFENYRLFSKRFTEEIDYSKTQLNNLRHDIEKNLQPVDSVKKFIEAEKNGIRQFESIVNPTVKGMIAAKKQFDEYYPEIEKIRMRLAVADSVECK